MDTAASECAPMRDKNQEASDACDRFRGAAAFEAFERDWWKVLPRLRRFVGYLLRRFGAADDYVDEILDESWKRCASAAAKQPINRTFILRTTRRLALSKQEFLARRQELLEIKRKRDRGPGGPYCPTRRAEFYRIMWLALVTLDSTGRRVWLEILRQIHETGFINYEEAGRALGWSTWKARREIEHCIQQIRVVLSGRDGNHDPWHV